MTDAPYDAIAPWYDALVRSDALAGDLVLPALFALVGAVDGQAVCDLACGQGRVARLLAERGAHVSGIDLSPALIAIAQRDEGAAPLGVRYRVDDAQTLANCANGSFDGVVCNLALMDIPDLQAVSASIARVLRPGGWFVCSLTHPCFESPHSDGEQDVDGAWSRRVRNYYAEGFWRSTNPHGVRGQVGAHHRTLATYFTTLLAAGLTLTDVVEPRADGAALQRTPGYAAAPAFLVLRWKRGQA